jgi:hypothetical protein
VTIPSGVGRVIAFAATIMKWYVPVGVISAKECRWTSPNLLPGGRWQLTGLEFGLDVPLWHGLFGGWSPRHGTSGGPI